MPLDGTLGYECTRNSINSMKKKEIQKWKLICEMGKKE
jgi:hypothetical protein